MEEEKLIDEVRARPTLYSRNATNYKNSAKRDASWKEVGNAVACDPEVCKKRWRSLRDAFIKNYKLINTPQSCIPGGKKKRRWLYFGKMQFLIPHLDLKDIFGTSLNTSVSQSLEHSSPTAGDGSNSPPQPSIDNKQLIAEVRLDPISPNMPDGHQEARDMPGPCRTPISDQTVGPTSQTRMMARKKQKLYHQCGHDKVVQSRQADKDSDEYFLLSLLPALKRLRPHKNALARIKLQHVLYEIEFGDPTANYYAMNHVALSPAPCISGPSVSPTYSSASPKSPADEVPLS